MAEAAPIGIKTILIVEDEALVRLDLVDFFEVSGWRVFEAADAAQAIVMLDRHKQIRVVLTDVNMPGSMDGVKLAYYVRERFPPTVLFVVSGNAPIPADELPLRTVFLPKPFDPHQLLRQIENTI